MTAPFEVSRTAPAHPHLTTDQIDRLRALLVAQLAEQDDALEEHDETLEDASHDVVDAAVTSERELAEAYVLFAREAAAELQEALDRLASGTYGWCEACHRPVPFERLEVLPQTRYCVSCPRPRSLFN